MIKQVLLVAVFGFTLSFSLWLAIFDAIQNIPGAQQW